MKTKPLYFYFLSALLIGISISFPIQILFEYDYAWSDILMTLDQLTYLNLAVMFGCIFVAYDALVVSWRLKYSSLILINLTIVNNAFVGFLALNYSIWETNLATVFFVLPFLYLLKPQMKMLLKESRRHWWKTSVRYERNWAVKIDGFESMATSMNISSTGILVKVKPDEWEKNRDRIISDIKIPLTIKADDRKIFNIAKFVREQNLSHGNEIGLAFQFQSISGVKL